MKREPAQPERRKSKLPASVLALAAASFFNDIGSEMGFPLLPVLLVSLGAGPAYLGIVEGIADAVASLLKLAAGYLADRVGKSKPLVMFGYGLPCGVRPLLALVTAPFQVLGIRVLDRVGKGLRTAPRDALIAASVPRDQSGSAFGFHRTMDHAGGVLGPLIASGLLAFGFSIREVLLAALIPSLMALVAVAWVREAPRAAPAGAPLHLPRPALPRSYRKFLAIMALFAVANSSDAFLLLRASEVGVSTASLPLMWTALHLSRMASTYLGGHLADRFSRARLIALGWLVFALCYLGMGAASEAWHAWALFMVYGAHTGLCEPAERALIRDLAPEATRGRAFGLFHGVVGACAIPAGLGMGWLWQVWSAQVALTFAAILAVVAALALLLWDRELKDRAAPVD